MTGVEVTLREAEVVRVRPGEFLLIKVNWPCEPEEVDAFMQALSEAGLERGRFAVINSDGVDLAVVEGEPPS